MMVEGGVSPLGRRVLSRATNERPKGTVTTSVEILTVRLIDSTESPGTRRSISSGHRSVSANTCRNGLRLPPLLGPRNRTRRWGCQLFQGESESAEALVTLTFRTCPV